MRKRDEVVTLSTIIDEVKISSSVPNGRERWIESRGATQNETDIKETSGKTKDDTSILTIPGIKIVKLF